MKHYIDSNEQIFAFESDGSQDHLIKPDMQPITPAEIAERNKPTPEEAAKQTQDELTQVIQNHLDTTAQEKHYDSIFTLVGYRGDPYPKFAQEAEAAFLWRSEVWATGTQIMEDVKAGVREVPTADELIAELPTFTWPTVTGV